MLLGINALTCFPLPFPSNVFRFNWVATYYPPDPCIRPNEGDLTCLRSCPPQPVNHSCMPPAGTDTRLLSDVFRFHKVYPPTCACTTGPLPCPCTNTTQCFPDPCAVPGNVHYKSQGYSTDRSCTQLPVQRADKVVDFRAPCPHCPHAYYPSYYACRPVYNRKYLLDCPEQDGPPADT
ncbi:unnamed protein product [Candidula unifasciata]|uniref:Uncharacterized protein n=1 Tax=Candidula unifasciata TaxID=100452 RepID=A0A8S3ZSW3_9EUPU|nr:unnamed protein product [Candidula unifasciata]